MFRVDESLNALTKYLDTRSPQHLEAEVDLPAGLTSELIYDMCRRLDGFPRHLGIHSGGMVVAQRPLCAQIQQINKNSQMTAPSPFRK